MGLSDVARPGKKAKLEHWFPLRLALPCHGHSDNELLSFTEPAPFCPHSHAVEGLVSSPPFYR